MLWKNYSSVEKFVFLGITGNPQTELVLFPFFLAIYLITLVGNSLIIIVTVTENSLQTPMYFFLTNLSFIDICYSSTNVPRMLKDLLSREKFISAAECIVQMYVGLSLGYLECMLLPTMAYDRYIAICYPLHYTTIINRPVCIRLAAGIWICGFSLSIFIVTFIFSLPMCGHNEINHFTCEPPEVLLLTCTDLSIIQNSMYVICITVLMVPITFIIASYIKIVLTILKIATSDGRQKTFSTCASHMIVVALFYGMLLATYIKPTSVYSPEQDKMVAIVYTVLTPMLNPLIYTLRNKEVITALKNMREKTINFLQLVN